ncbi:MAG: hypothetical protein JSS86_04195 [Cyanobacteria bacterium SZAS LIN-2]|nr:hypothetical protein [Cyanobacteria bacterium SZAS LIN-2]
MQNSNITGLTTKIERLGVVASPNGRYQAEGVLNPAIYQDRKGNLVMMMRSVAHGNQSRLEMLRQPWLDGKPLMVDGVEAPFERVGFALVPQSRYERRRRVNAQGVSEMVGGEGCEDPRVTFVPVLDCYLLCYTAFGFDGPRIAVAMSRDGYKWQRLGLLRIPDEFGLAKDDKDAAFFPDVVLSPDKTLSLALLHRPMPNLAPADGLDAVQTTLKAAPSKRQCVRIAYIPLAPVLEDIRNVLAVAESRVVLEPTLPWGHFKVGGGTAPIRLQQGWLEIFHGVDQFMGEDGKYHSRYAGGLMIHDLNDLHKLHYVSPEPLFKPETKEELEGIVNNVVFPTGIVARPDLGENVFDIYYGMADRLIGRCRLTITF